MVDIKYWDCNRQQATKAVQQKKSIELGGLRIVEKDLGKLIEEIRRRYQLDEEFNIHSNEIMTSINEKEKNH